MAGRWSHDKGKHRILTLRTDRGRFYFHDPRRFGTFGLLSELERYDRIHKLGLQILEPFTISEFLHALHKGSKQPICDVLIDQEIFSGIGNYLRADIMYQAELYPLTKVGKLTREQQVRLCKVVRELCRESLACQREASDPDSLEYYIGEEKAYRHQIYGQEVDPKGRKVHQMVRKKRTIHWVPEVQYPGETPPSKSRHS